MLRAAVVILAVIPVLAVAQPAPNGRGQSFTREQFVQRAADIAGRRFDTIDTNHAGVLTRDQIRAYRQSHGGMSGKTGGQFQQ